LNVLLIAKRDHWGSTAAANMLRGSFPAAAVEFAGRGDPLPAGVRNWRGDYLISYLAPMVLPAKLLERARCAAINFHPGPPEYPGIGCTNFAIYDGAGEYGVTCHHMAPQVDSGSIVATRRFPVFEEDSVFSLTQRSYAHLHLLFADVLSSIVSGNELPSSAERWARAPYTREQLNALGRIDVEMSQREIDRRIRAMEFPGAPGAYIDVHGRRFWHSTHWQASPAGSKSDG